MCGRCQLFHSILTRILWSICISILQMEKMKLRDYSVMSNTNSSLSWIQPKIRSLHTSPWSLLKRASFELGQFKKKERKRERETTACFHKSHEVNQGNPRLLSCYKVEESWHGSFLPLSSPLSNCFKNYILDIIMVSIYHNDCW